MKIICSECKKEIDDTKKQCPNCGFKNKFNKELYLKKEVINNCPKCGNKIAKGEVFCTKCGNKINSSVSTKNYISLIKTLYKRNKIIAVASIIVLLVFCFIILDNKNFNRDIALAENYYNSGEYYEMRKIINKYQYHSNNELMKKYKYIINLLTYLDMTSKYHTDSENVELLIIGYTRCLNQETSNEQEKEWVDEVINKYYKAINKYVSLSKTEIEELCAYSGKELTSKIDVLLKKVEKSKACEKSNIKVATYSKSGYHINVTLKNNNGCSWNIKSYDEVRVYFTDSSYEDVYLSTNVNLQSGKEYTFNNCYLGSENKYKTISRVVFIG